MSRFKERLIALNISVNKEIFRYVVILILLITVFVVVTLLTKIYPILIGLLFMIVLFTYFYFSRYKGMERKRKQIDLIEFVNLFTFFKMYLKNGFGVYSSLKEIANFANPSLREKLEKLISDIDVDKTIEPYINFAHSFEELIVEEMMISIYQMVDDGADSNYLIQFELIFDKFSELLHSGQLNAKDKSLANLTSSSLIGSAYLIIMISVGVISLLGEMINVI